MKTAYNHMQNYMFSQMNMAMQVHEPLLCDIVDLLIIMLSMAVPICIASSPVTVSTFINVLLPVVQV